MHRLGTSSLHDSVAWPWSTQLLFFFFGGGGGSLDGGVLHPPQVYRDHDSGYSWGHAKNMVTTNAIKRANQYLNQVLHAVNFFVTKLSINH